VRWDYTYDLLGRVTDVLTPKVSLQLSGQTQAVQQRLRTHYTQDAFGNIIAKIEAMDTSEQRTTSYGYDQLNRQTLITQPPAALQLTGDTAPNTHYLQTLLTYDSLGNLTGRTAAYGTLDARTTSYAFDTLGRQITITLPGLYDPGSGKVVAPPAPGQAAPANSFARTVDTLYDAFDDAVRTRTRTGSGPSDYSYKYTTYDAAGRIAHSIDAMGYVTAFGYDVYGDQQTLTRYSVPVTGSPSNGTPANGGFWTEADIATTQPQLASDAYARTMTTAYDTMGRKTDVTQSTANYYYGRTQPGSTFFSTLSMASKGRSYARLRLKSLPKR